MTSLCARCLICSATIAGSSESSEDSNLGLEEFEKRVVEHLALENCIKDEPTNDTLFFELRESPESPFDGRSSSSEERVCDDSLRDPYR